MRTRRSQVGITIAAVVGSMLAAAPVRGEPQDGGPSFGSGWVRQDADVGRVSGVVAGAAGLGFVVLTGGDGGYWSADGLSWDPITLPVDLRGRRPAALAASERGFVAAGPGAVVAFSEDGRSWSQVPTGDLPDPTLRAADDRTGLFDVVAGPDGFLIVGRDDCALLVWSSPDGLTWTAAQGFPEGCVDLVTAPVTEGWVGLSRARMTSQDGVSWVATSTDGPVPHGPALRSVDPARLWTNRTLAVAGSTLVRPVGSGSRVRMFTSEDGGTSWDSTGIDGTFGVDTNLVYVSMAVGEFGFVGAVAHEAGEGLEGSTIIASGDGWTWSEEPVDLVLVDLAAIGDTVVAVGTSGVHTWRDPTGGQLAMTGAPHRGLALRGLWLLLAGASLLVARRRSPLAAGVSGDARE